MPLFKAKPNRCYAHKVTDLNDLPLGANRCFDRGHTWAATDDGTPIPLGSWVVRREGAERYSVMSDGDFQEQYERV